jgi:HlyD family secretion protein
MKTRTWIILGVVVVAAIAVGVVAWISSWRTPVEVAKVTRGEIQAFVDERGKTRLPQTYLITMPLAGRIEPIELIEGTPVKEGQVVARISPVDLKLAVDQTDAVVERLKASIRQNDDNTLEESMLQQTLHFKESMERTVAAAEARWQSGLARLDFAEKQYGRVQKLFEKKTVTEEQLDAADSEMKQRSFDSKQDHFVLAATQALTAATDLLPDMVRRYIKRKGLARDVLEEQQSEADAKLDQVKLDQQRGTMTSPVNGVVLQREVSNERFLISGTTLLEIGRLEDLEVEADVLSLDVVSAKVGDAVEVYGPAIGRPRAHGTVKRIYPAGFTKISSLGVEQQRVKVIVAFEPDDLKRLLAERHLGVGYRVRVRITTKTEPKALIVPRSALFRGPNGAWQLYVVRGGRAEIQAVKVGILNDRHAEITGGLEKGDLVIRAPESNLQEGQRVKAILPQEQPPAQPAAS